MNRRPLTWTGLIVLSTIVAGCDYAPSRRPVLPTDLVSGPLPSAPGRPRQAEVTSTTAVAPALAVDPEDLKRGEIILANFTKLIETAALNPGGQNFAIATENLNDLFSSGINPGEFDYPVKSRDFLLRKIYDLTQEDPEKVVKAFCGAKFSPRDARHIEDCMLYRAVALRVAGEGDDLTRVRRIFDWTVRNILLVPPESLSGGGYPQAQVRPADVLARGMATENGGRWSERGWLFMSLCRQIGIDVGLVTYSMKPSVLATPGSAANRLPVIWICGAVVANNLYLFDQRIGMEIPGPDGSGVATLEEAITNPQVLGRMSLPGLSNYPGANAAELAASPTKIGILIDSSQGYLATRMRLLQGRLRGEHRTVLFRDPYEQGANFSRAMKGRLGLVTFWDLPAYVEQSLFNDSNFVASTQMSLQFFDGRYPLLYARAAQLRGNLVDATNKLVALRFAENAVMNNPAKDPIPAEIQRALDLYATYFLAQCHLDQGNSQQAEYMFRKFLELSPEPGPNRYFYYMLRWGALSNMGRLCEARGDRAGAVAFYSQNNGTFQRHGNLLRARNLVWNQPFEEAVPPCPSRHCRRASRRRRPNRRKRPIADRSAYQPAGRSDRLVSHEGGPGWQGPARSVVRAGLIDMGRKSTGEAR